MSERFYSKEQSHDPERVQISKVYIAVTACFDLEGAITSLGIEWENGKVYKRDKELDVRRAASLKAGTRDPFLDKSGGADIFWTA